MTNRRGCRSGALAAVCVALGASHAAAQTQAPGDPPVRSWPSHAPTADQGTHASSGTEDAASALPPVERPFLYLVDPTLPHPMRLVASYSAAYSPDDAGTRPLAATANRSGLVNELRVEAGLHERVSLFADGLLAPPHAGETRAREAFGGGARFLLTDPTSRSFRLALSAAYQRDFQAASIASARVEASYDIDRLRLAGMAHTERAFAVGRDGVDMYAALGASYRVLDDLRVGAEYVGQDLEGAWDPTEREGGVRHFVGTTLAFAPGDRLLVSAGPALGLNRASPEVLGKAALSYLF